MRQITLQSLFVMLILGMVFYAVGCSKTVTVYYPPHFDLTKYSRVGIITFTDNARPSVAEFATERFQNEIFAAKSGIAILNLGTEAEVLKSIGSTSLDAAALIKIGKQYMVSAVFTGDIVYSQIRPDVNVQNYRKLKASVDATLHGTLSAKLTETGGGATVWGNSVSWHRKVARVKAHEGGFAVGLSGHNDACQKLVPDMVHDVTNDFRGRYQKERAGN